MTTHSQRGLRQFFDDFFHPAWQEDAPTADEVISSYISEANPGELTRLADQLDTLASAAPDDEALEKSLASLGCHFVPSQTGLSARAWLRHVGSRLRKR